MKIGIVIGRIGGVDGVALETEKWITVLERLGHDVCVLAGALEGDVSNVSLLEELAFDHPANVAAQRHVFFGQPIDEDALLAQIERDTAFIERGVREWIARTGVECVVSENANALPFHLAAGLALQRIFAGGVAGVCHDHDFRWERGDRYVTAIEGLTQKIEQAYPVRLPNVRHAVINSAARRALAERCGIEDAVVVPNVMDFKQPFGRTDEFNSHLRGDLGLAGDDLLLFQITRIVRRKGIEIAIDLLHRLDDPRVKLVITGTGKDEHGDAYVGELRRQVERCKLGRQVLFAGAHFNNQRGFRRDGGRVYALGDAYAQATACTYFSTYEGFGNAFVEAVVARRVVFVNNYEPVYWPDIGSLGFKTVQIEGAQLIDEAVQQAGELLDDEALRRAWAEHNFALGEEHFSYEALARLLGPLFSW